MSTVAYKTLGQLLPTSANTYGALYTVPTGKATIISSLIVTNTTAVAATFTIANTPTAATTPTSIHLLAFNVSCGGNSMFTLVAGLTLEALRTIQVATATASSLTFQIFGQEITL